MTASHNMLTLGQEGGTEERKSKLGRAHEEGVFAFVSFESGELVEARNDDVTGAEIFRWRKSVDVVSGESVRYQHAAFDLVSALLRRGVGFDQRRGVVV